MSSVATASIAWALVALLASPILILVLMVLVLLVVALGAWLTSCAKSFWAFLCRVFARKKPALALTVEEIEAVQEIRERSVALEKENRKIESARHAAYTGMCELQEENRKLAKDVAWGKDCIKSIGLTPRLEEVQLREENARLEKKNKAQENTIGLLASRRTPYEEQF